MSYEGKIEIMYSPKGLCEKRLVELVVSTKKTIRAMVFSATLMSVAESLVNAKKSGVYIQMVLDRLQTKGGQGKFHDELVGAGIDVRLYSPGPRRCMHHKVGIFDGKVVSTGSFNWTINAQNNNDENFIVISAPDVAEAYQKIFDELWEKASLEGRSRVGRKLRRFGRYVLTFLARRSGYE